MPNQKSTQPLLLVEHWRVTMNGAVVIPGDAEMSRLVQALEGTLQGVAQMPLGAPPLAEDQIHGIVEAWITAGALDK